MTMMKGPMQVMLSRPFVNYTLYNQVAIEFLAWLEETSVPDETFFSSLQFNPQLGAPGAYASMFTTIPLTTLNYFCLNHGDYIFSI